MFLALYASVWFQCSEDDNNSHDEEMEILFKTQPHESEPQQKAVDGVRDKASTGKLKRCELPKPYIERHLVLKKVTQYL